MLKELWYKISHLGVTNPNEPDYRQVVISNKIVTIAILMVIGFIPIEIILNGFKIVPVEIVCGLIFSLPLYFNYKQKFVFARYFIIIISVLMVMLMTYMVGGGSNSEFVLLVMVASPLLLFKNKTHIFLLVAFIAISFLFLKTTSTMIEPIVFVTDEVKKQVQPVMMIMAMLLLFFQVYYFSELNQKFEQTLRKNKQEIEERHFEIQQSIQYAQKIQSALLPNEDIFKTSLPDSFILFKPKDIVSGDFYWISDKEDNIFYATADCTGHGVPGGFMSMLGTALLNEIIDERKIEDCGQVLTLMREKIIQALKQAGDSESKDGMDMVLIKFNKQTLEMEYAAANNSFYLVSNKQLAVGNENCKLKTENCQLLEMPCDKMPVGVYHSEVKPFQTFKYQLQKGDIIYTYTDGYADQFGGEKGKKYTYKRLREKLVAISEKPLAEQKVSLESEFENWKGEQEQVDDVCVIGVKI
jgi:serine phosphatase RsbU (regulator of sigma subunit)